MEQLDVLVPEKTAPILTNKTNALTKSTSKPFIEANTISCTLEEIKSKHIIPTFSNSEALISHVDFIETVASSAADVFRGEQILQPSVRLSHPIKGRIPEAKDKPANQLLEYEKTLYYERMAFIIELPNITDTIDGNTLSLTIGGVKAYNQDNLYSRSVCDQKFRTFIGFKNSVCTNLCVWTNGTLLDLKVKSIGQLKASVLSLLSNSNQGYYLNMLRRLPEYSITEQQFANLIGRCRLYNHLPASLKSEIPVLSFTDTQLASVCRDYFRDSSFCRDDAGNINLWKLYNLFTGSNKSSYIDQFVERGVNAYHLIEHIRYALDGKEYSWYLN
jgi:hypothetical protein